MNENSAGQPSRPALRCIHSKPPSISEGGVIPGELELAVAMANQGLHRWLSHFASAVGHPSLGPLDLLILQVICAAEGPKRLSDMCLILNVEETHTVSYSLRKLCRLRLIEPFGRGRERTYGKRAKGTGVCESYETLRGELLASSMQILGFSETEAASLTRMLRAMSGLYDQAARVVAAQ